MNAIWTLCIGMLIMTLPFSASASTTNKTSPNPPEGKGDEKSAAGLGAVPATLCLLIPAATLYFIHGRS